MRTPIVLCDNCGSESVRRSKRQSLGELLRMYIGMYPFRCMECDRRFWVSVWLFSRLPFAKCPKCLNVQLNVWPAKYFAPNLWRGIAVMLGARRYRCMPCRHNFVSFRPMFATRAEATPAVIPASEEQAPELLRPETETVLAGDSESSEKA